MNASQKSEQVIDKIETMILLALDANKDSSDYFQPSNERGKNGKNLKLETCDTGILLGFETMRPKSAFTFDLCSDRVLTWGHEWLKDHPSETLGDECEVICIDRGSLKWLGARRLAKAPRRVVTLGKPSCWYEMHYRKVLSNGAQLYQKRAIPVGVKGNVLPAKIQGNWICGDEDASSFIIMSSIIEDARRANTMLASVKYMTEIKFPVPLDAYKEVFSIRDAPMVNGRRKAIIHWVSKHLRASTRGKLHDVNKHTRGVKDIVIDGIRINIEPND